MSWRERTAAGLAALLAVFSMADAAPFADAPRAEATRAPSDGDEKEEEEEDIVRLESWPPLADEATARTDLERVCKARSPEMASGGHDGLVRAGAGAVPLLLRALARERDAEASARLVAALDALTGPPHTRLLAKEFADPAAAVRTWCLRRVARFADRGVRADAEAALERATKRSKKEKAAPEAEFEVYVAGLCCASAGSIAGIDAIARRAEAEWGEVGGEVRAALEGARGPEATRAVVPWLEAEARERRVAGLRLLAGCGDRETALPLVSPFLDSDDNSLRIAAINALRGIVDGAPPLERMAVFDAIEEAKRWKERL